MNWKDRCDYMEEIKTLRILFPGTEHYREDIVTRLQSIISNKDILDQLGEKIVNLCNEHGKR
ncbi:MAG: hypothetical protein JXB88_08175 [Spirochaetales bacterium]|nr:hypothetical protein [Spirochaetales bacterium]